MADMHYGNPILLENLTSNATATSLSRISRTDGSLYAEARLQDLIMTHPGLLPASQIEPAFKEMVPICQEMKLHSNSVDNVFLTPDGDVALVECKLWRNPEARRKVIAQIIEYASALSTLSYTEFESAVLGARLTDEAKDITNPSLFRLVHPKDSGDEAAFHDAVVRTLKRGRFLLIILGDGIQEGLELMVEHLQKHVGLHFTLALVELALFEVPERGYLAQPRILGKTVNIPRGVIVIHDSRVEVLSAMPEKTAAKLPVSISSESFYEKLDAVLPGTSANLQQLFVEAASVGVKPDFKAKTVTLRWLTDDKNWNLGTVAANGELWMDYHGQQARNLNLSSESREYLLTVANATSSAQVVQSASNSWNVRHTGRGPLLVTDFVSHTGRQHWIEAIIQFQQRVGNKEAE